MNIKKTLQTEIFITISIMVLSLFLYMVFRVNDDFQKIIATISFLLVLPIIYIRLILKKSLSDFGISIGQWKKGVFYSLLLMVLLIIIFSILFTKFNFVERYYLPASAIASFKNFILREIFVVGFFLILYEFFFRGFVFFYFLDKLKSVIYANLIQTISFWIFLVSIGTFDWARAPYILIAPLAGVVAGKSQSILYSFVFSWLAFLAIDSVFIKIIVETALTK